MIFNSRYKALNQIGAGGMGVVYKAEDIVTKEIVAIKNLNQNSTVSNAVERFKREIAAMSSLNHKNIVSILDYEFGNEEQYIVQEFVKGSDLSKILENRGNLKADEAVDYLIQISKALSYMHKNNFLHKDLKPSNILITSTGNVKICDFGLTQTLINEKNLTKEGKLVGSRYYIAPELVAKEKPSIQSEIFAIGVIAYEMLIGKKPFDSNKTQELEREDEVQTQIRFTPLPRFSNKERMGISQALENFVIKATAKRPVERYNDFDEMIDDLNTVFDEIRIDEPVLKVTQKYQHMDRVLNIKEEKIKFQLPIHVIIFIILFLILLIGVFIYAS